MNDADLGDNIEQRVAQVEDQKKDGKRFENDDTHMSPTRWWFASSAFPMLAGTFGPMASAFSICALCRPWRQSLDDGATIQDAPPIPDPEWLIVVNAIQLVIALISNMFLLLNMARRVRFSIAQPITIVGWYLSSIALACLLITAAVGPLRIGDGSLVVWSQAFYYGLFAAILYFIDASLMVVTVYGAYTHHYSKDFQLTPSQRTLMLQTIMYLFYLLIGALIFSKIEDWAYLDGVYWANQTLFTVGYGDFPVEQTLSRALLIPYVLIGVITLGLLIGSIRSLILERGRNRLDARMVEKQRRKLVRTMTNKGCDEILEPVREPYLSRANTKDVQMDEYERRRAEFLLMRKIQARSTTRRRWMAVIVSTSVWLALWLVGAAIFQQVEYPYQGWTYFDGFYFAFVTLLTLGYGDRTPISPAGKSFFVLWTMLALPTMTIMISNAGDTVVLAIKNATLDLGSITILPGDRGFVDGMKKMVRRLSFGKFYPDAGGEADVDGDDIMILPPGFLGAARQRDISEDDLPTRHDEDNSRGERQQETIQSVSSSRHGAASGRGQDILRLRGSRTEQSRPSVVSYPSETFSTRVRRSLHAVRDPRVPLPSSPADYHYLLAAEIASVSRDAKRKEPRRYSFAEWAWYLKLIGEDEADPYTHRKAKPHVHARKKGGSTPKQLTRQSTKVENGDAQRQQTSSADGPAQDKMKEHEANGEGDSAEGDNHGDLDRFVAEGDRWSWVGSRSPLMGSMEESEWILEKLTQKLMHELERARHG
ncbi:ion channel protein [Plectosphaerella plurivora]|uniref:Ion channel protein n=1 Tax=Plectosphaerella plurivora TaxID=936078 RepID=A0A9P9A8Y2_9PEZI|nr:ion channel protein [Plectosphaerella plurivora]